MVQEYAHPILHAMEDDSVALEPLTEAHAGELFEVSREDADATFHHLFFGPFDSPADIREWIRGERGKGDRTAYAIRSNRLAGVVGTCCIMSVDTTSGSAEIGSIWCAPPARHSEVIPSVVFQCLGYLFGELHYRRVVWKCDVTNDASRRAAERFGFSQEGIFRKHLFIKGRSRDTVWYSIIDDEWPSVRRQLQEVIGTRKSDAAC